MAKEKKIDEKRAEQNRIAQNKYRQKQSKNLSEMKQKIAQTAALEAELITTKRLLQDAQCEIIRLQNINLTLMGEREQMIHLMDKLRTLLEQKNRIQKVPGKPRNISFIQPMVNPRTQFTSLKNTFTKTTADDSTITVNDGSLESEDVKTPVSDQTEVEPEFDQKWTSPQWQPLSDSKKAKKKLKREEELPFHLKFSYSDSKDAHKVHNFNINHYLDMGRENLFLPSLPMQQLPIFHHIPITAGQHSSSPQNIFGNSSALSGFVGNGFGAGMGFNTLQNQFNINLAQNLQDLNHSSIDYTNVFVPNQGGSDYNVLEGIFTKVESTNDGFMLSLDK